MKQKAEKHLEIALGGNMNISTLTPLALIEIMTDFAKKQVEAINYTRCCESDSEQLVLFADWLQYNGKWSLPEQQAKDFLKEQQKQN
tara:strand:- start:341 stop:601 length:261 start_codon:yes stop_codon:yes gene_type:complete